MSAPHSKRSRRVQRQAPHNKALAFERLEERVALDASTLDVPDFAAFDSAPSIRAQTNDSLDGAALRLELAAYYPDERLTAQWIVDWGDGAQETIVAVSNSIVAAHYYAPQMDSKSYDVVVSVVDCDGEGSDVRFYVATHVTQGKLPKGDFATSVFCDAEKSGATTSNLCWANGAANALYYAGWAQDKALADLSGDEFAFDNEDDVFDYLANSFTNKGASVLFAAEWFITGDYQGDGLYGWAQTTRDGGGFYPDVEFDAVSRYFAYMTSDSAKDVLPEVAILLRNDWGVCISLAYYNAQPGSTVVAAHTLTLWGYECNPDYNVGDPQYFTALIVSDSDDGGARGRYAPNETKRIAIEWNAVYRRYRLVDYQAARTPWIEEFVAIAPRDAYIALQVDSKDENDFDATVVAPSGRSFLELS